MMCPVQHFPPKICLDSGVHYRLPAPKTRKLVANPGLLYILRYSLVLQGAIVKPLQCPDDLDRHGEKRTLYRRRCEAREREFMAHLPSQGFAIGVC